MTKSLLLWIPLLFVIAGSASSVDIDFSGDRPENASDLTRQANGLEQANVPGDVIADSIATWLRHKGYLQARTVVTVGGITVTAGDRHYVTAITVRSDSVYTMRMKVPFVQPATEAVIDRILSRYRENGHYYVRANVDSVITDSAQVRLVLGVNPGPVLTVDRIRLDGLKRTDPAQLRAYLPVRSGQAISEQLLQEAEESARTVDYVQYEPPVAVQTQPGFTQANLRFRFREKRQVTVFGGGGYVPDDETGLVWNLRLELSNLFGKGRQVRLATARPEDNRTTLEVRYTQPMFLLALDRLALDVSTRDYRDNFYEFGLAAEYGSRFTNEFEASVGLSWRRIEPATELAGYSAYSVSTGLHRTGVDDKVNPTRGINLATSLTYTYRRYSDDSTAVLPGRLGFNETRTQVGLGFYYPIIRNLIGHLWLEYRGLETNEGNPPLSELYLVGGPGSLRGYRNERFAAQRVGLTSLEPRFRFESGYLFVFYDAAYLNLPVTGEGTGNTEIYEDSYGFGFSLGDNERMITLSLGWNDDAGIDQPRLSVQFSSDI